MGSSTVVAWKGALDDLDPAKLVSPFHIVITFASQGFLVVEIQHAVGFRIALPGQAKQFADAWHA
jgi:hypothetical protein